VNPDQPEVLFNLDWATTEGSGCFLGLLLFGYMVVTIKTSKEKQVVMKCDQGEEYVNMLNLTDETRQKETHTR
jgi:hypothetical protein